MRKRERSRSRDKKNSAYKDNDSSSGSEIQQIFKNKQIESRRKVRQSIYQAYNFKNTQPQSESQQQEIPQQKIVQSKQKELFVQPDKQIEKVTINNDNDDDLDMFNDEIVLQTYTNPTDAESYYKVVSGQLLHNKYKVIQKCGKGVFGNVVKAMNIQNQQEVAIKILRNNEILTKSGEKQFKLISKIKSDYVVKCYQFFMHRKHLCLVFQLLSVDLRQSIRIHGKSNAGLDIEVIKTYAIQMFIGLHAIRKHKLIHADIKPDNILVTKDLKAIKFCDFGTAFSIEEANIIQYLVARYYRAPEIILGCNIEYAIDTWSVGCTLFELFTGDFLFPGKDNNQVLKYIMETKGKFSMKMLKKGVFTNKHFDHNYTFLYRQIDQITKQPFIKPLNVTITSQRELLNLLKLKSQNIEHKKLVQFKDFLEQCTVLNPRNRMTPEQALEHPFLNYQMKLE